LAVDAALVIGAACFVGILAQISIPLSFTPVPLTGQTFGVLLAGSALGWKRGGISMAIYVLAGLVGVPWYASHSHGWAVVSGATGGYLVGFVVAAAFCGWLAERGNDRTTLKTISEMVVGNWIIYLFGATWLWMDGIPGISTFGDAISKGVDPFLLGDGIKVFIAALILPVTWKLVDSLSTRAKH
jgi:biotin transport system substrate-specific component